VGLDTRFAQTQIGGVWRAPRREHYMRADNLLYALVAACADTHPPARARKAQTLRIQPKLDAFALEDLLHLVADLVVFAADGARTHLDHGDAASEAAIHLREL